MMSALLTSGLGLILSTQLSLVNVPDEEVSHEPETVAVIVPETRSESRGSTAHPIYKGVVGNLLEGVPMDPERRIELQRASAAISAPFTGRTLGLLLGVTNPAMFIAGGVVWGLWAASQISPVTSDTSAITLATQYAADVRSNLISD
jgi:hypothetical protein